MIHNLSQNLSKNLGEIIHAGKDDMEIYAYGIEIVLGALIKFLIMLILAVFLGILETALIFMFIFSLFRFLGGGVHLSTYLRCLVFGLLFVLGSGYIAAAVSLPAHIITSFFTASLIIGLYICFKWVPAGTAKKQITDEGKRLGQKKTFIVTLALYSMIVILLLSGNYPAYALACIYGSLLSSFFITPLGYSVMATVDKIFNFM